MAKVPHYKCSNCVHRNSRNVLRGSNGICVHCKTPYAHSHWRGGTDATLGQLLLLSVEEDRALVEMADSVNCSLGELAKLALTTKLREWKDKDLDAVKKDMMLEKLYRV